MEKWLVIEKALKMQVNGGALVHSTLLIKIQFDAELSYPR